METKELADQWSSTKPDEEKEEYILTPQEEALAIDHAITSLKKYAAWRMADKGLSEIEIMSRISQMDFPSMIDREKILATANSNKQYDQWQRNKREQERKEAETKVQEIRTFWTAKNVLKLMKWTSENEFGKALIMNHNTTTLIKALCFFLSEDARFESELGYSFQRGLLIRGVSGLGKTFLVQCSKNNELNPVLIQSMIEITEQIKSEGEFQISMMGNKILYLDDVGTEETPVKHYGTNINWFKDFLELYYSKRRPFNKLMISTNLSFRQLEEKYGFRVRSRMKDMLNVIDVQGEDLRGS